MFVVTVYRVLCLSECVECVCVCVRMGVYYDDRCLTQTDRHSGWISEVVAAHTLAHVVLVFKVH